MISPHLFFQAKLLPPDLAECYKIMTQNPIDKKVEVPDTAQKESADENSHQAEWEEHGLDREEEGEEGLTVSQDEHGNYFIDINERTPKKGSKTEVEDMEQQAGSYPPQKKKNVLLPKRTHKHLSLPPSDSPGGLSDTSSGEADVDVGTEGEVNASLTSHSTNLSQEGQSRTCNVCGITRSCMPSSWWHMLSSPLASFDNITVSTALKVTEHTHTPDSSVNRAMALHYAGCERWQWLRKSHLTKFMRGWTVEREKMHTNDIRRLQ